MSIPATLIKELRDRTGIGMGKCKEALIEAEGDIELAISNLRKAGMASAVKKEGRETKEGKIAFSQNRDLIALAEAKAETDFVINNEKFVDFLNAVVQEVALYKPQDLEQLLQKPFSKDSHLTIDQYRATLVQTIGENIQIKRMTWLPIKKNHSYGIYSHMNGKILTLVEMEGSDQEEALAREIAMHAAAAAPEFLNPEAVPQDVIAHEKEIAASQVKGKPEYVQQKIVDGKIQAFYDQACLMNQKFIKDDSKTIQNLVDAQAKATNTPLKVIRFIRWSVAE